MAAFPLIATKLALPRIADDLLQRPRLLRRLEAGLRAGHPLFLLSAPAGAGKSTLLATWLEHQPGTVAWLSLDRADNDPVRFLRYLMTALPVRNPGRDMSLESTLGHGPVPSESMEWVLSRLLEELASLDAEIILVLDDYHVISNAEVKQATAFLLEGLPPNVRLVISTRADPQLPVPRFRVRGLLTEIRGQELSFTAGEAEEYLNVRAGLNLEEDELRRLATRTEGWVAGVRLAALALAGADQLPERRRGLAADFSGRHHFVLDYLLEEVLAALEKQERSFLLHTSPLDRFSASLADQISPLGGWGESQTILTGLLQKNIFIVPLDAERTWFRYHHLFADLLRSRLRSEHPGREQEIHRYAAAWFESRGLAEEAIEHALSGADWETAGRLVAGQAHVFLERGELMTVMSWLERLPREVARHRPAIALELAWALTFGNRLEEAEQLLRLAEEGREAAKLTGTKSREVAPEEESALEVGLILLRGYLALPAGRPQDTVTQLRGFEELPGAKEPQRAIADWLRGYAYRALGEMDQALEHARRSVVQAQTAGPLWQMLTVNDLAITYFVRGQLGLALEQYERALALGHEHGRATHGFLGRVQTGLAQVYLVRHELDQALEHATLAFQWSERWTSANHLVHSLTMLARVRVARGELDEARAALERAEREKRSARLLPTVPAQLEAAWVDYWLAAGNLERAEAWSQSLLDDCGGYLLTGSSVSDADLLRLLALLRVRLTWSQEGGLATDEGTLRETAEWLGRAESLASAAGWKSYTPGIIAARALVARRLGDPQAQPLIRDALEQAAPAGIIRSFLEWGREMELLLRDLQKELASEVGPDGRQAPRIGAQLVFLDRVLGAFGSLSRRSSDGASAQAREVPTAPGESPIEPLTPRETEVLRLLDQGLSNKAIAQRLFVSAGTVKTHTHRLYRKLGVQSRTAALARARELGLL